MKKSLLLAAAMCCAVLMCAPGAFAAPPGPAVVAATEVTASRADVKATHLEPIAGTAQVAATAAPADYSLKVAKPEVARQGSAPMLDRRDLQRAIYRLDAPDSRWRAPGV